MGPDALEPAPHAIAVITGPAGDPAAPAGEEDPPGIMAEDPGDGTDKRSPGLVFSLKGEKRKQRGWYRYWLSQVFAKERPFSRRTHSPETGGTSHRGVREETNGK